MEDDDETPSGRPETLTARMLEAAEHHEVPLRTIVVTVTVVVAAGLLLAFAWVVRTDLILFGAAVFLAVLLAGPVGWLEHMRMRRSLATAIVFFTGLAIFAGVAYLFGSPLVSHLKAFANNLPDLIAQAKHGQGWVGHLVNTLHLHNWVVKNAPKLSQLADHLADPALHLGEAAVGTIFKLVTILMLTYFLLLDLPRIWRGTLVLLPEGRACARRPRRARGLARRHGLHGGQRRDLGHRGPRRAGSACSCSACRSRGCSGYGRRIVDLLPIIGGLLAFFPAVLLALPALAVGVHRCAR